MLSTVLCGEKYLQQETFYEVVPKTDVIVTAISDKVVTEVLIEVLGLYQYQLSVNIDGLDIPCPQGTFRYIYNSKPVKIKLGHKVVEVCNQ
jgi:hypothetical protein